jgi:hypothetical protein
MGRQAEDEIEKDRRASAATAGDECRRQGKGRGLSLQLRLVLSCGLCCTHFRVDDKPRGARDSSSVVDMSVFGERMVVTRLLGEKP